MSTDRTNRKEAICQLVRAGGVRTQADLMSALREQGFKVTQGTVSRDLTALELEKDAQGFYVLPQDLKLRNIGRATIKGCDVALNQVVVHTEPGAAQTVAAAIDASSPEGVLGSVAGDDTILVVCKNGDYAASFDVFVRNLIA